MQIKPIAVGFILFGILAIGGTLDGAFRKARQQPDWVAMNWKSMLKGVIAWLVVGLAAVIGGIVALLV